MVLIELICYNDQLFGLTGESLIGYNYIGARELNNNNTYDSTHFFCFTELSCVCDSKSVTRIEFDSIQQRPVCDRVCDREKPFDYCVLISGIQLNNCTIKQMNYTIFSSQRIGVEVTTNPSCFCDLANNIFHDDFCIPNRLLLEYQQYQGFRPTINVFQQVKYLMLFCHLVKNQTACQQLANLCVLSFYSLGRSSPCNLFYTTQTSELALNYGEKTRPYLFYRKGKYVTELLDKIIDDPYDMREHNKVGNLNVSSNHFFSLVFFYKIVTFNPLVPNPITIDPVYRKCSPGDTTSSPQAHFYH